MILNSVWYIVKGVKKTFSLAVYKWFHQMNIKLSWIESNDYVSCHSNFKSFVWFPISPPRFKLKKEQRPEELWTEVILDFCIVTIHGETVWLGIVGHQLAKDSLSWIDCKRRQKCSKCFTFCVFVSEWGRGFPSSLVCNEKLLPSPGPGLKPSL